MLKQEEVQHLLLRAGFGTSYKEVLRLQQKDIEGVVSSILNPKLPDIEVTDEIPFSNEGFMAASKEEKKEMVKIRRSLIKNLNTKWIMQMVESENTVAEKLTLFWHDHFACRSNSLLSVQNYLNTLRTHALGNFRDLLHAVAKDPAMLAYLNNQQNKKQSPNENFAREVMELFTLGMDNGYTDEDIKQVARAFTGWGFNNKTSQYTFRKYQHDYGEKTIFGKTGNFNGEQVLDMLLENKATARHIAEKWVAYFVNDKGDKVLAKAVGEAFYASDYDIKTGLATLFTHKRFYAKEHLGVKIKSPVELIVGIQRMTYSKIQSEESLIFLQNMLGQRLLFPPNVAGWSGGKSWLDNSTLAFRVELPKYIFLAGLIESMPKDSGDIGDQLKNKGKLKKLEVKIELNKLQNDFENASDEEIHTYFLQVPTVDVSELAAASSLTKKVVLLTSQPTFQLC
ncbi:DUF1800 domain-containing protein [Fulvivirga sp. M361]|uniref:DUF1800 domain-containing protein n=1 Tax=Fulvivirga sp. M361 TaxID=2594266 RepID=UPI00117BB9CF|nr:DUF1800 domain-containing protein [Fulvivirga sp. M361]TRX49344.1 DUF1800 domain-containing protein [Fulvivirga sp. M361]